MWVPTLANDGLYPGLKDCGGALALREAGATLTLGFPRGDRCRRRHQRQSRPGEVDNGHNPRGGLKRFGVVEGKAVRMTVLSLLMPMPDAMQKRSIAGMAVSNSEDKFDELTARSSAAARGCRS